MGSYYDMNDILAQEELVPCTTLFDFSHLPFLDPDNRQSSLPANSRIQVPIWAMEKWALMNYVHPSLPKQHFGPRARERLEAEPAQVNLRQRSTHAQFFRSGRQLVTLMEQHVQKVEKVLDASGSGGNNRTMREQRDKLARVELQAAELRKTLLHTYKGDRLKHTLNWALSCNDQDDLSTSMPVNSSSSNNSDSGPLARLDDLEAALFRLGAQASRNQSQWKALGRMRQLPNHKKRDLLHHPAKAATLRTITPEPSEKRQRTE